ncbi:MAG: effector-associated domain EAD1-containing protein, partial [Candidatus Promineifilaceae bacterium]
MSLKQSDLEQALYGALINAFDRASLSQLLRFHLGKRLDLISGDNDNLAQTVTSIIDKSTQEGWTTQLIEAAQQNNPTNQLLKQLDPSDFKYTPIASTSTPKHIRLAIGILVFATISSLIYLTLFSQKPQQMSGDFRIAVAGFTEQSPSVSSNSRIGMELAESVSLLLQKNIDEVHLDFIMTIWGPERVRIIEGGNEIERAIAAAQLA